MADGPAWWADVVSDPIDLEAVHAFLVHPDGGGTCLFVGRTRRWTGDIETAALRYEAYVPMATAELRRLALEAAGRWGALRTVLVHRLGDVEVGAASVVVGVACAHRAAAFDASRWLIDTLKDTVPIWKTDLSP